MKLMLLSRLKSAAIVAGLVFGVASSGVVFALSDQVKSDISAAFVKNFPQITVESVSETKFSGLFELVLDNGESVYVNQAADHLLVNAKLLQVNGPGQVVDLHESRKAEGRQKLIKTLGAQESVLFKGAGEKATPIYVFTDVECGYCRKLHEEVPALQKAGIDVQYFAWPRAGVASSAGSTMHNIWCAKDQQSAMTAAKSGGQVPDAAADCQSPLAEQLKLGAQLGVAGTPAIFTESGRQIGGYAKASELIQMLEQDKKETK